MNKENMSYDIDFQPIVNDETIDELATLFNCGELSVDDMPSDDLIEKVMKLIIK